jgi:hypothetical protein
LIADQKDFVAWWDEQVGVRHGAGRGHKNNADLHSCSMEDAEQLTGVKQWQVSRWRTPVTINGRRSDTGTPGTSQNRREICRSDAPPR